VDAFEEELTNVTIEEIELREWRKRGPIGKLHNLIRYAYHSSKRKELLKTIQRSQYCRL
jgi:iron-sulfur cluster repair protein YtfE (RIC family)